MKNVKDEVDEEIRSYRTHSDMDRLMKYAASHYGALMKYASYLLGHIHGINKELNLLAPEAASNLAGSYFQATFEELEKALETMWSSYGQWSNLDVYRPLMEVIYSCYKRGGLHLKHLGNESLYVDVPFTPETMPI